MPFNAVGEKAIFNRICAGLYDFQNPAWDNVPSSAKHFVRELLTPEDFIRPTAAEALELPFIVENSQIELEDCIILEALEELKIVHTKTDQMFKQKCYAFIVRRILEPGEKVNIDRVFRFLGGHNAQIDRNDVREGYRKY